jgi:hypothetical protein
MSIGLISNRMEFNVGDLVVLRPEISSDDYGTGGTHGYCDDRRIGVIVKVGVNGDFHLPSPMVMVMCYCRRSIYNARHLKNAVENRN